MESLFSFDELSQKESYSVHWAGEEDFGKMEKPLEVPSWVQTNKWERSA